MSDETATPPKPRDHSEAPDDVAQKIAAERASGADDNNATSHRGRDSVGGVDPQLVAYATEGVHDIKLTRFGHYHAGNGAEGRCFAALVTGVHGDGENVDISVWPSGIHDAVTDSGVGPGLRAQLTVPVDEPADRPAGSFHLSRECPWKR